MLGSDEAGNRLHPGLLLPSEGLNLPGQTVLPSGTPQHRGSTAPATNRAGALLQESTEQSPSGRRQEPHVAERSSEETPQQPCLPRHWQEPVILLMLLPTSTLHYETGCLRGPGSIHSYSLGSE